MNDSSSSDADLWAATVSRARAELNALPVSEQSWLAAQVSRIGELQTELDLLFCTISGPTVCSDCLGVCCSLAKHHATLTNILGYLLAGEEPPTPDFALPCPFLGAQGCRLPVARRPFNCIIFLCDMVDRRLSSDQRIAFAEIEAGLRDVYQAIADRCPGASLRGLLIAAARVGHRPLLQR
jgi:hypothetical protein